MSSIIQIGIIEYEVPSEPIGREKILNILSAAGKDVIRIAWKSLVPDDEGMIRDKALATWFCAFFNMARNAGNGTSCINLLVKMDILEYRYWSYVCPRFKL